MADQDYERTSKPEDANWRASENDALDRELDAALTKYTAVEPRAGLEERILANLRTQREHAASRSWWGWRPAIALAAALAVLVAVSLWISRKPTEVVHRPPVPTPGAEVAASRENTPQKPSTSMVAKNAGQHGPRHSQPMVTAVPKLDVFPSPQPLSEQEQLLANYVTEYPEHAVLVARALTEALRHDQSEEMQAFSSGRAADSGQPSSENSDR
jgi:hypothetical protein